MKELGFEVLGLGMKLEHFGFGEARAALGPAPEDGRNLNYKGGQ